MDPTPPASQRKTPRKTDTWFYLAAALAGAATAWADLRIDDLLFTALLVLASCMLLGLMRPSRPWRWVITIGVCVPLTELAASAFLAVKPSRAQIYGSFLLFLPGVAGAYGGSMMRRVLDNLRQGT
jgi:ABC-type multidrug transport system permease subunit